MLRKLLLTSATRSYYYKYSKVAHCFRSAASRDFSIEIMMKLLYGSLFFFLLAVVIVVIGRRDFWLASKSVKCVYAIRRNHISHFAF